MPPYQRLRLEKKRVALDTRSGQKREASVAMRMTDDNDWSLKVVTSDATTGVNKSNYILLLLTERD